MRSQSRDLTVDAVLADPMIRAVMRADGVDLRDVETLLRSAARRIRPAPRGQPMAAPPIATRWRLPGATIGTCLA